MSLPIALLLASTPSLVVVSWDGAADWVVDRLLSEGKLPTVARMAREGAAAEAMTQAFPSKTAVGHFTLFSGTWPRTSGVVNNSVPLLPRAAHTILESRSGFDGASHFTEPMWVTLAKSGKRAICLSAAGSYPPAPDQARLRAASTPLSRFVEFSGFEAGISSAQVVDPTSRRQLRLGDTDVEVRPGGGSIEVEADGRTVRVGEGWAGPLRVRKGRLAGNVWFQKFDAQTLYVRAASGMQGTQSDPENEAYVDAYGGFHDTGFGPYQDGKLGSPLYAGGDGTAERRLIEIVRQDIEFLKRSFRYGLKRYRGDVYWHYSQASDDAGHCWMGLLDPNSSAYRPELAAKIWPFYAEVFRLQDEWLGDMMRATGPHAHFALVSDHGMAGITKYFNVNSVLESAGLLTRTQDGKIDLSRTQICAPPWGDNQLVVNYTDWRGGIVPIEQRSAVVAKAEAALLAFRDRGLAVVTRTFRPDDAPAMGIGGVAGGDLFYDVAPDYYPSGRLEAQPITAATPPRAAGVHGMWPLRRDMEAIFYLQGPKVARGVRLPRVRSVDAAPTLLRLLGVAPSRDNEGLIIGQAIR